MIAEKYYHAGNSSLVVRCKIDRLSDVDDLRYQDFEVLLYKGSKYIAEISRVLDAAGLLTGLIDSIDWKEVISS